MHSTIEEAWPTHQSRPDRGGISSKECDLFQGRTAKVKKPYKLKGKSKRKQKTRNMMLMDDEDYENGMLKSELEKYHGYEDSRVFSRTKAAASPKRKKKIVVKPEQNTYEVDDSDSDEDEDEGIEEEMGERDYIFEEVYEEDDDNYLSENLNKKSTNLEKTSSSSPLGGVVEEELEGEHNYLPLTTAKATRNINDMNQLLDLSIYTLSGILLIVILEQFVQLGVKLKSFN